MSESSRRNSRPSIAVTKDGDLVVGNDDGTVMVIDVDTGEQLARRDANWLWDPPATTQIRVVATNPETGEVAFGDEAGYVYLWSWQDDDAEPLSPRSCRRPARGRAVAGVLHPTGTASLPRLARWACCTAIYGVWQATSRRRQR